MYHGKLFQKFTKKSNFFFTISPVNPNQNMANTFSKTWHLTYMAKHFTTSLYSKMTNFITQFLFLNF